MSHARSTLAVALLIAATTLAASDVRTTSGNEIPLPGVATAALALDADQDGALDLAVAVTEGPRVVFLRGDGVGGFAAARPVTDLPAAAGSRLLDLVAADLDLDGNTDLVGAGSPATVWWGARDGTFTAEAFGERTASHVAVADLDRDGDPDVLLVTPGGLVVLRNDGGGRLVETDTQAVAPAWPVVTLDVEWSETDDVRVVVRGASTDAARVWIGTLDCTLVRDDTSPVVARPDVETSALVRADLDRDGRDDEVAAAPDGRPGLVVHLARDVVAVPPGELTLAAGRLSRLGRADQEGLRVHVRAGLPAAAGGHPTRLELGDPASPLVVELAPDGWSEDTAGIDVWRDDHESRKLTVVVDRAHGTIGVHGARVAVPVVPEQDVEIAITWEGMRAEHRAAWRRSPRGDLVYRAPRDPGLTQASAAGDFAPGRAIGSASPGYEFETKTLDGRVVTLLRDRRSGALWRLGPDGKWEQVDARGRTIPSRGSKPSNQRREFTLLFRGPVDGSDEIRIDAAGAVWISRHWGLPHGSATLNGVSWSPRAAPALVNAGETAFLPAGVDFGSARLVRHSGRDLLALDVAADHVTLKVSDSPNGPGIYEAAIRFEIDGTKASPTTLETGLLLHRSFESKGESVFKGDRWDDAPHVALANRPFAVAMWLRVDGDAGTMGIMEQRGENAGSQHLHLMLRGGQRPYLGFYMNDLIADRPVPRDGEFHHLVFQFTGEAQEIWMDGERVAQRANHAYLGTKGATRIGRNPGWTNVGGTHLQGALRDFRIYGRALTSTDIASLTR